MYGVGKYRDLANGFGDRIRRLRGRLGLTQTQFAQSLGVSFASVNRWENGQSRPSTLAWRRIVAAEEHGIEALNPVVAPSDSSNEAAPVLGRTTEPPGRIDFSSDSRVVRAVAEGERLEHGYLSTLPSPPKHPSSIRCLISG